MTSPAIKLAKECGINATFVCGKPEECPDDENCCHHSVPQGRWIKDGMIETFHAKAQAQALRDAAEWLEQGLIGRCTTSHEEQRRMAEELERS